MGGSKERTYVGLQVQPLMDNPDEWYKSSMREAFKNIPQGMRSVMNQYSHNMMDTRGTFNDGFLTSLGYNPREDIKYRVVDPDLVLNWAKSNISNGVTSVTDYKFAIPTMEELALEFIQDNYVGMDLSEKSFYIDNVKWYVSGVTVVSSMTSDATCYKNKETTVNNYALLNSTTVLSIGDTIVVNKGINCWSALLGTGLAYVPVEYITINCPGINTDILSTLVEMYDGRVYPYSSGSEEDDNVYYSDIVISVKLDANGELEVTGKAKNIRYTVFSANWYTMVTKGAIEDTVGKVKLEIKASMEGLVERLVFKYTLGGVEKLKIAEIAETLVSGIANAKAYPIIPLRENYAMVNETNSMKAVLNKLGMSRSDFENSLDDSRLKNAAVLFVVDINDSSEAGTKYIFETLVDMVTTTTVGPKNTTETSYHLDYGFSDVNMYTKLNFTIKFTEGNVAEIGKYVRTTTSETYQTRDPETNAIVTVTDTYNIIRKQINEVYYQEIKITSGNTKWEIGGYNLEGTTYIPVVDIGLAKLSYEELCYILSLSASIMTTSITVVKSKWYQSGFFKFVMIVAIAVAAFFTGGYAMAAYGWLAAAVVYAGAAVSILGLMGINTGVVGQVIGVAALLVGGYMSIANATTAGTQTLATAQTLTQLASVASEFNLQGMLASIEKQKLAKQEELEASGDMMQGMQDSMQSGLWLGVSDRSPDMLYAMSSTQMMCNYDILYDYDGLIDGKIKSVGI